MVTEAMKARFPPNLIGILFSDYTQALFNDAEEMDLPHPIHTACSIRHDVIHALFRESPNFIVLRDDQGIREIIRHDLFCPGVSKQWDAILECFLTKCQCVSEYYKHLCSSYRITGTMSNGAIKKTYRTNEYNLLLSIAVSRSFLYMNFDNYIHIQNTSIVRD